MKAGSTSSTASALTDARVNELKSTVGVGVRRGLSTAAALLNALAWAGGDTTPLVPAGEHNPTTYAQLVTALQNATSGQTVRIPPRTTIVLTAQLPSVPVGVNVVGGGAVQIVSGYAPASSTSADQALMPMLSAMGVNGNQRIQYLTFLGNNYQASGAIYVRGRSNVKVRDCVAFEFNWNFVTFNGRGDETDGPATTKATGNGVYNCASTACCRWVGSKVDPFGYASGIVQYGSQVGFELKDSTLVAKGRGNTDEGYCLKFYRNGHSDGTVVENCTLRKSYEDGTPLNFIFAGEIWHDTGLIVRNCFVEGRFDLNGVTKGSYQYGAQFLGNVFGTNTMPSIIAAGSGIALELSIDGTPSSDILIDGNVFKNQWQAIYFYQKAGPTGPTPRVTFRNNKCLNTRLAEWVAANTAQGGTTDWVVVSNTFRRTSSAPAMNAGIKMPDMGTNTNWTIRRNIIAGFDTAGASAIAQGAQGGTTSGVTITDNIFNDNTTNGPVWTVTPGSLTVARNSTADPIWDADDTAGMRNAYSGAVGADEFAGLAMVV